MSLRELFGRVFGWRVMAGPFRGLRYVPGSIGSVLPAKLLGSYECELRPWIARLVALQPERIVNVGAGEGYYAVGLARRLPDCSVIAFESEPRGRQLIRQIAGLNRVESRLEIRGACTAADLGPLLDRAPRPAVIMDVEGAEVDLLDVHRAPGLARSVILVEIHEFSAPVGASLRTRFRSTHHLEEIPTRPRRWTDLPVLLRLAAVSPWRHRVLAAMDELRPGPMRWFWLEPHPRP